MNKKVSVDVIQCVTAAVVDSFAEMCSMEVTARSPHLKTSKSSVWGVSGIMGLSGEQHGVMVLTLPEKTALRAASNFAGDNFETPDVKVVEAIKEFVNVVVGAAKTKLDQKGYQFDFTLPKVVVGYHYITEPTAQNNIVVVPFSSPAGDFLLDVSLEQQRSSA